VEVFVGMPILTMVIHAINGRFIDRRDIAALGGIAMRWRYCVAHIKQKKLGHDDELFNFKYPDCT